MAPLQNSRGSLTFLLELLLTGLLLLLEGSHCQQDSSNTGANFVYYYNSPTQRTHVTMNQNYGQQFLNNPFFSQNHQQQSSLPFATSQSPLGGFQYQTSSVQPLHQQFLYQQPTVAPAFTQSPLQNGFQFPFQQQVVTPPSGSFSTFNRFGKDLLNNQQNAPQLPNQAPPQQQQGGSYSFFESPYQFLQQRFTGPPLGTPPTPSPTPEVTTPAQVAPVPEGNGDADAENANRKPKFSSRFRYVEHQVNPYSRLSSFTSDLPYREQRFYSTAIPSVPTPTGYSYSIGTEDGSKATVHVSMGPASLTNYQHLTEITGSRLVQRPQTFSAKIPAGAQVASVAATTDNDVAQGAIPALPRADAATTETSVISSSPSTTSTTTTTPTPIEVPQPSEPLPPVPEEPALNPVPSLNTTEETLIKESSFQTESIASPRPELSRKLSEINIPKRLVIRTRVARKRLQLAGDAGNTGADGTFLRRRISQNRLPDQDESKVANEDSKGSSSPDVASSAEARNPLNSLPVPSPATPSVDVFVPSTSSAPALSSSTESGAVNLSNQRPEDYYEYYTDQDNSNPEKNDKTSDLPILHGFTPNDFPGVFKHHPDGENSVETEQGELITRYKSSRPAVSDQNQGVPVVQAPVSTESSRLAPIENSEEHLLEIPAVQAPSSTSTEAAAITTTPTSTTSTQQPPSDDYEESHIPEQIHESPNLPSETSSSTPSQNVETDLRDHLEAAVISSTTEQHQSTEVSRHSAQDEDEQSFASSSTSTTPEPVGVHSENVTSSTEESTELPEGTGITEFPQVQNVSPGASQDGGEGDIEEQVGESPSNTSTVATPTSTSRDVITTTEEGEPSEFEDFSYSQEELTEEEQVGQEEDDIAQAQRLALQETLRRLRERQNNMQDNSTAEPDTQISSNTTSTLTGSGRRRSRYFVRRPIAVANLTLPTSGPIPNINAVLEDNEGDLSRSQVIEKIQRFRANTRRVTSTTTKRPRRVTRPSSERAVQLDQVDSFSESSSVGVDVDPYYPTSSTPKYTFTTETLTAPLSHETTTVGEFSTISVTELSPFPPTTSTPTQPSELSNLMMLPTTERTTAEMTLRSTTIATARTTTFSPTRIEYEEGGEGLYEEGHDLGDQLDEPEQFPEGVTTPATSSTREVFMTTTESTPSTTPLPTTSTPRREANPQTIPAGQLVIHEILPTQPPLKEVSFVIGESVEDDQVIQESKELNHHQAHNNVSTAIVRVEANVQISSSVSKSKGSVSESDEQQSSVSREGKKVRVVMVKRRKTATGGNLRRQKRKL